MAWIRDSDTSGCCNAAPPGAFWPVCARPAHADPFHESADYEWQEGEQARLKGSGSLMPP